MHKEGTTRIVNTRELLSDRQIEAIKKVYRTAEKKVKREKEAAEGY